MADFRTSASPQAIKVRADLLRLTREFFDQRGFLEVQTPLLSSDTVVDRHLDPIAVDVPDSPFSSNSRRMWLQTSPEFAMKRMVASGIKAIYQITPAFRVGESGPLHNPEFTMLEWYRVDDSYDEGISLLGELASALLKTPQPDVITMSVAFHEFAGFDALRCNAGELFDHCKSRHISVPESIRADDWDSLFDILFTELVQPRLGLDGPAIVKDYPASQSALAKVRNGDPPVAERFELFVRGVELANGYHELLDANELKKRNEDTNQQRQEDGKQPLPTESRLLNAMQAGLPPCVGVALGFDRLVMLKSNAQTISDVLTFPYDIA